MRVMASGATYAAIIRVALAVKYAIRLEADVVDFHALQQGKLLVAAMTGSAKLLRQFVATKPRRIENQLCASLTCLNCCHMWSTRSVTPLAAYSRYHLVDLELVAANGPG